MDHRVISFAAGVRAAFVGALTTIVGGPALGIGIIGASVAVAATEKVDGHYQPRRSFSMGSCLAGFFAAAAVMGSTAYVTLADQKKEQAAHSAIQTASRPAPRTL